MHTAVRLTLAALLLPTIVGGCDHPTHPNNAARTIAENFCHALYDCCTPSDRALAFGFFGSLLGGSSKETCLEEFNDKFGGLTNVHREALAAGKATFDADAAERCTKAGREALAGCDLAGFVARNPSGFSGAFDVNALLFSVDASDPECSALAQRSFTRGNVAVGGDCQSFVECADFATCEFAEDTEADRPIATDSTGVCVGRSRTSSVSARRCWWQLRMVAG